MTPLPRAFSRRLRPGSAAVLHLGLGEAWWWGRHPIVSDDTRLWWARGTGVHALPWPGAHHVLEHRGVLHAWCGDRNRHRVATARGWAERSRYAPLAGPGGWFPHAGFLYQRRKGGVRAVDRARARWLGGPGGALLGGSEDWAEHGATQARTPRPLPVPLWWPSVRFSSSGRWVAGITPDEETARVDLQTGRLAACGTGVPVSAFRRQRRREHSPAVWEHWAAGPGGVVWDLRSGRRAFRPPVLRLGVTIGTPAGFVTVDWATHEAWMVTFSGQISWRAALPLAPDDTTVAGAWGDGAVHLVTALGEALTLVEGRVQPGHASVAPPAPTELSLGAAGSTWVQVRAVVGAHRFGWTEDGWLFAMPLDQEGDSVPPSTSDFS